MSLGNTHKPIRINMGGLLSDVNTMCKLFCFYKQFTLVDKGLMLFSGAL